MRRHLNPLVFGVRLSVLCGLYVRRLRDHAVTELLAGAGIAVGVALVFGVLVANGSIVSSVSADVHALGGSADLQVVARSPGTFSPRIAQRIAALPGVRASAPLLRQSAVIEGYSHRERVQLIGAGADLTALGGAVAKNLGGEGLLLTHGIGVPANLATAIGAEAGRTATLAVDGVTHPVDVRAVLSSDAIGPLASAAVVVALLHYAQTIAGASGQVSEVLVEPAPGAYRQVLDELRPIAGQTLDIDPADRELALAETAAKPVDQSTSLFVAIAAMVGFLLALNAMLLTVPERRRTIADMRVQGFDSRQVLSIAVFQALVLGAVASCVGIFAGELLARTLFHQAPSFLTSVFPVTASQTVGLSTVLAAFGCGLAAALLVSLAPVFDLRSSRPVDAVLREHGEPGQAIARRTALGLAALGLALTALVGVAVAIDASLAIAGGVLLALAALCLIPLLFRATSSLLRYVARRHHGGMLAVTTIEMEAIATRSIALAGVAALAVYGSVSVGGARHDLLHGLDEAIVQEWGSAPVWVTPDGNIFDADSFRLQRPRILAAGGGVISAVHVHQGGFADLGTHRLWILAIPSNDRSMVLSSQLREGDLAEANARLRAGGWATVSSGFAGEHGLGLDSMFTLPTPSGPAHFRVAAITTNMGWPSGTISLNTADYSRYWRTSAPTALSLSLLPGVTPTAGREAAKALLAGQPGLRVQTSAERVAEVEQTVHQGLRTLGEISTLLLIVAALALASALSTAIYQRRGRLAALQAQGFDHWQLWRGLLLECAVVIGIGSLDGVAFGLYAHALGDRYLRISSGFPAPFGFGGLQVALTLLLLVGIALTVIALPGYSAAKVSPQTGFQEG
jgi:putative ABC transport system permease protein